MIALMIIKILVIDNNNNNKTVTFCEIKLKNFIYVDGDASHGFYNILAVMMVMFCRKLFSIIILDGGCQVVNRQRFDVARAIMFVESEFLVCFYVIFNSFFNIFYLSNIIMIFSGSNYSLNTAV